MEKDLIVKLHTDLANGTRKQEDVLSYYGVPVMFDQVTSRERGRILNHLTCGTVLWDTLNQLEHTDSLIVEIPRNLRKLVKEGKAAFDKSSIPGNFTPNIRIKGKKGIAGQATIKLGANDYTVTNCLANLATVAMIQSVLGKLEAVDEKIDKIIAGQKNDRIGKVIASFKGFMDLYPSFKSDEEMRITANEAYLHMYEGLSQIHLEIDNEWKELDNAPTTQWQAFLSGVLFMNKVQKYQDTYSNYIYDLQLYMRLQLLLDVILWLKAGHDGVYRNHQMFTRYCQNTLTDEFEQRMNFLMNGKTQGIASVRNYIRNLQETLALVNSEEGSLLIECQAKDFQLVKPEKR